jgi:hypothetical protein
LGEFLIYKSERTKKIKKTKRVFINIIFLN